MTNLRPPAVYHHHSPLELNLLHSLSKARRVRHRVRSLRGQIRTTRILQREPSPTSTNPIVHYTIDSVLMVQPKDVTLLLCSPVVPNADDATCFVRSRSSRVVIKAIPRSLVNDHATRGDDNPVAEIAALQHLRDHQSQYDKPSHVIHLLDCLEDEDFFYVVLPYLANGDLFTRVQATNGEGLPAGQAASYLRQMVEGLLFMKQTMGLAHHDVSLENVMLASDDSIHIIDLGMCLRVPEPASDRDNEMAFNHPTLLAPRQCCGKRGYVAPEVVREEACDPFASDIWSLGVCLYAMLTARPLYHSPSGTNE